MVSLVSAAELCDAFPDIPGCVTFEDDAAAPSAKVVLSAGDARLEVCLFGAHVLRWQALGAERLWISSLSAMDGSAPVRGGIPIAWPQFADVGPLPLHGFARVRPWRLVSAGGAEDRATVTLVLCDDEVTRAAWPHSFELQYVVELRATQLRLELSVRNTSAENWDFTTCFHGYWRVPDIERVALRGLQGCSFIDKVDGYKTKVEEPAELIVKEAAELSTGFVDRIYQNPPATLVMDDQGGRVRYIFTQSDRHPETVVFNPWIEGKKGDKGPDYDDDGYKYAICVEPASATTVLTVAPNETWTGFQEIQVEALSFD